MALAPAALRLYVVARHHRANLRVAPCPRPRGSARAGSKLFIDGNAAGEASAYNGQPRVRQKVFVESETKTLMVH